jgi:hypothetical protein
MKHGSRMKSVQQGEEAALVRPTGMFFASEGTNPKETPVKLRLLRHYLMVVEVERP